MAHPKFNEMTEFEFSEMELYQATRFSELNKMLIQTLMAQEAKRKLDLKVELDKYSKEQAVSVFVQQEAEIQGNIRAFGWLLWLAENTEAPQPETEAQKAEITKPASSTF